MLQLSIAAVFWYLQACSFPVSYSGQVVASKIRMRAGLRYHTLLLAQFASIKSVFGLDRSDRRPAPSDIGRQRGFRRPHGARRMEHLVILRVLVHSYGGSIKLYKNSCQFYYKIYRRFLKRFSLKEIYEKI